eukprot:s6238_g3.t1
MLSADFMVQDLWRGGEPRIFVVARTCTWTVYFDSLVQIQESVTEMEEEGKKRPAGAEAEDRAIERKKRPAGAEAEDRAIERFLASSKENADDVEHTTAEAQWLQKTAEEIRQFKMEEVSFWVRAALEEDNYTDEAQEIAEILKSQKVNGTALLKLTYERLVAEPYKIAAGPAGNLAERIAAVSAPPMAASGFQDDLSATEFIQELASAKPQDLGEGVQVFNLKTSLPVEPYGQSGPNLLTRNTTRRAWKATFELMRNGTKRVQIC